MTAKLNLVVAHKLEAQPLVQWFALQPVSEGARVYSSGSDIRLIITGMGRHASSTAVHQTGKSDAEPAAWMNIGIAGHKSKAVGEMLVADKIVTVSSGSISYPVPLLSDCPSGEVHTVDKPELEYPQNVAYDMEAGAFFDAAASYTTLELVQSLKLISDNSLQGTEKISKDLVLEIFAANSRVIQSSVESLLGLQARYSAAIYEPEEYNALASSIRLTATQQIQVRRLCQRYHAFGCGAVLADLIGRKFATGRDLVNQLEAGLVDKQ